jgi:hypothetical protein
MEITKRQRNLHVTAEAIAVVAVAPLLLHVAAQERPLTKTERHAVTAVAIGTLLIDGYLLYRYLR